MPNRSEIGPVGPLQSGAYRRTLVRPERVFVSAVLLVIAVATSALVTLPSDLVMPLVASTLLGFAAVLALVTHRIRPTDPRQVSCKDVAGALTLIGACVATTIEPEQMMRLLVSH